MFSRKFISRGCLPFACLILFVNAGFGETKLFGSSIRQEAPRINAFSYLSEEGFHLGFEGAPGDYDIEFSEDLKSWTRLSGITFSSGAGEFMDEASRGRREGFYRISGSFTAADYHILAPSFGIEFSGAAADEKIGNLWAGISVERAVLQFQGLEEAATAFPYSVLSIEGRVSPSGALATPAGHLLSLAKRKERETIMTAFTSEGWNASVPAVSAIPNEPLGNLYSEGSRIVPFTAMEGDWDSLVGLEQRRSAIIRTPDATEFVFGRRDVVVPLMVRKSLDANRTGLDGPWGFIRLMLEANPDRVRYSGGAYTFQMNAAASEMDFSHAANAAVEQVTPEGSDVAFELNESELDLRFPFRVEANGAFEFTADEGPALKGFVSPSAHLFVVGRSRPNLDSLEAGETVILDENPDSLEFQYGIGVRRERNPQLGGKTYRMIHHGFWVADGWFDVGMKPRSVDEKLIFSPDGSSAARTAYASFFRTTFTGDSDEAQQSLSGHYEYDSVSVDSEGRLLIVGGIQGESDARVRLYGFAQEGGRLLILIDTVETDGFGIGIGVAIAVLEE